MRTKQDKQDGKGKPELSTEYDQALQRLRDDAKQAGLGIKTFCLVRFGGRTVPETVIEYYLPATARRAVESTADFKERLKAMHPKPKLDSTERPCVRTLEDRGYYPPVDMDKALKAAERLAKIYFDIAAEAIGEDEVRRVRDEILKLMEATQ